MKARDQIIFCALLALILPVCAQPAVREQIRMHQERAQAALSKGQPEAAIGEFREILRLDPKSAAAHANLWMIWFKQAQYAEAADAFAAAVKLNSSLWDALAFLGLSNARLGRSREAELQLKQALNHVQNQSLRTEIGMELIRVGQETNALETAVDALREMRRSKPDDPELLYFAYRLYSDLAAQAVSSLARSASGSARLHQVLAQAALSQDDLAGAITEYRKALEIDPALPGLHYELGRALLQSSQDESVRAEAQQQFEAELRISPADANSEFGLGEVALFRSNPQLAVQHYHRALELRPAFAEARLALGKALATLGRGEEALVQFREAARLDPENEMAHYRLAQAYREAGQAEEAAREHAIFRKLRDSKPQRLEKNPRNAEPRER